jgi:hypothetical protein
MPRQTPLLAAALCLLLCAPLAHAEDADTCEPGGDVPININPVFDDPQYDFTQNLAQIQVIASDRRHSIPQYHAITMGITRYEPVLEFRVPVTVRIPPQGPACVRVQHVDVTIGYRDVTVFIASEIPQHTCAFDETMGHEQKHIDVNRKILDEFAPLIEDRFKAYLELNGTQQVANADDARQIINDKLKSIMDEIVGQMEEENIRAQREVDSAEEYARLSKVCEGELTKIANRYRRLGP